MCVANPEGCHPTQGKLFQQSTNGLAPGLLIHVVRMGAAEATFALCYLNGVSHPQAHNAARAQWSAGRQPELSAMEAFSFLFLVK